MPTAPIPFTEDHLDAAVALFADSYRREQAQSLLLPARAVEDGAWIRRLLEASLRHGGVAIIERGRLLAYMLTGDRFHWKGQEAAIVLEHGHASVAAGRGRLYQSLYLALSQSWADQGVPLHLIRHFAHDAELKETLYQLGFGAILAERLRGCTPPAARPDVAVRVEPDPEKLIALHAEQARFFREAPIFLPKTSDPHVLRAELAAHAAAGDAVFVCDEDGEPCAYLIVGESGEGHEGLLLHRTNTAQIKVAFARPDARGRGLGAALLQRAIAWSQERGYDRVFVEHETANISGGNFWRAHFEPFLHSSMRYIDPTHRAGG